MKLRNLKLEVFTGTDPDSLTNGDGDTLDEWLAKLREPGDPGTGEEEFIEPIEAVAANGTVWVFIQYAEG